MFSAEDGAWDVLNPAIERYSQKFGQEFPVYDYIDWTANEDYDFTLECCKKLAAWIDKQIAKNKAVGIPEGYFDRVY